MNKKILWIILIVLILAVIAYVFMNKTDSQLASDRVEQVTTEVSLDENGVEIAPDSTEVSDEELDTETPTDEDGDNEEPVSSGRVDENGIEIAP